MKVAIASDHAGFELKSFVIEALGGEWDFIDCGTNSLNSVDYPDYAKKVTDKILKKEANYGILLCGTGIGMSITANKRSGIRAALCHNPLEAKLTREHNDANVLCLGARIIGKDLAIENIRVFLSTTFAGGRHQKRIEKIEEK